MGAPRESHRTGQRHLDAAPPELGALAGDRLDGIPCDPQHLPFPARVDGSRVISRVDSALSLPTPRQRILRPNESSCPIASQTTRTQPAQALRPPRNETA